MRVSLFTHDILLLFAGPLVWAIHFLVIYGTTGVLCARPPAAQASWLGIPAGHWAVGLAGLVAVAALAACARVQPRTEEPHNRNFVRWMTLTLNALALVAIVWETLPILLLPACR
jgi:hypothetical protein